MGYYINQINGKVLEPMFKAQQLISEGATLISEPEVFQENLVCVVENSFFDAAGYVYCEQEMEEFKIPDGRVKRWLIVPNADVLSGYKD